MNPEFSTPLLSRDFGLNDDLESRRSNVENHSINTSLVRSPRQQQLLDFPMDYEVMGTIQWMKIEI